MNHSVKNTLGRYLSGWSRRDLFRRGSILAAAPAVLDSQAAHAAPTAPATAGKMKLSPESIYQSIGVRPLINSRGTFTIISGSLELPEVRAAAEAAAQYHVHLDELMEAVARRISEITQAEWALVSAGCAAGIAHTTAACVTGGNPDLLVRVPDLSGFPKDEVVIPKFCRNQYDQAVRSVGVRIIEVGDAAEYEAALGPKAAMVYIMAGPRLESGPLTYDAVYSIAKKKGVPVLNDAAAEMLTIPNEHLRRGATFVAYSGGKCLRGPQCAGLVLGRKDLLQAAWVCSAPHHGHGRAMKIGKEEIVAMLAAVEMWALRDHRKEDEIWTGWMQTIADRVGKVDGVTAAIRQPPTIDNHSPSLAITWDTARLGLTGQDLANILWTTEPRIAVTVSGGRASGGQTGISITAYQMKADDVKIVADRLHEVLSARRPAWKPETLSEPAGDLNGRWDVKIQYAAGTGEHTLHIRQQGNRLTGTHQGDFTGRDLTGTISGNEVRISSSVGESHGASISYHFTGKLEGDSMSGNLDMGEYLSGRWSAKRHVFGRG
ncbi:MAG TPA: aminotransferase class V-fold PLP-dependent enzyme [Bryobacteraceae bacterium]|nr:aminotransferase class V-fold PLP-dependent enzyme [Bryobacteraceae bacterium]